MNIERAASQDNVLGFFVGNQLSFSDSVLSLAERAVGCLAASRISALHDLLFLSDKTCASVHLIIVDESMLENLRTTLPKLRAKIPNAKIALAYRNPDNAIRLIRMSEEVSMLDSVGVLPMNLDVDRWLSVLRLLLCGERFIPAGLVRDRPAPEPAKADDSAEAEDDEAQVKLTPRELQVLEAVAQGKQNKIIAETLNLSQHTVKLHLHHLIAKLGVDNRTEAAIWYLNRKAACQDA